MNAAFYIAGTAGLLAQQKLNSITHNLANVDTIGYRAGRSSFSTFLARQATPGGNPGQTSAAYPIRGRQYIDSSEGALVRTDYKLDMALNGHGYFRVRLDNGSEAYTRAGNFQLDAAGNLVTTDGKPVLDDSGSPITLPTGSLTVLEDGDMSVNGKSVGHIGLVQIIDPRKIRKMGGVLLTTPPGNVKPAGSDVRVMQGFTESSNVNAVQAMVELMSVQRSFQSMMKMLQQYDHLATLLNEQVGRVQTQ